MENKPLKIKKRGDDGYRFISVRIKESTLAEIDKEIGRAHVNSSH